ncbi:MAG: hypothetical protein VX528_13410 [Candidatus Latescibacterota bacterium]|nr:hypothetical protein [Candidatus Latescibacterota bacterium]
MARPSGRDRHAEGRDTPGRSWRSESDRRARVSFDEAIIETFRAVPMGPAGIDLEQEGLRGSASTWTYLVNDDSTADHLANLLTGNRDMGMNVGAGLMWPLLGLWIAARKLTQRRR